MTVLMRVRRLRGDVEREPAGAAVEVGDAAARFERRGVAAREADELLDLHRRAAERVGGRLLIADLVVPDVVGLLLAILSEDGRVFGHRLVWVGDGRQRCVVDLDRRDAVGRGFARVREDGGDFLILEEHFAAGEHHLLVLREGRHPIEAGGRKLFRGDDRFDAGHFERRRRVDVVDRRVTVRTAHERHVDHLRQHVVVEVVAPALDEAAVFFALDRLAKGKCVGRGCHGASSPFGVS